MDESLVFIHLSDIHFNKRGLDHYDVDRDLRDQLERDVGEEMHPLFPVVHRVLVSGDIAFAGKKEEYAEARRWLKTLCQLSGCREEDVLCIPGNHDVDRSVYSESATLQDYHDRLRTDDSDKIDEQIARYMRDSIARPLLFKSIEQYNDFASIFRCASKADPLAWQRDLKCNDGSILRVHGINSTLASDPTDDNAGRKLIVGKVQARPKEERGVAYLVMCHHPPDWLFDQDEVHKSLTNRARIQLFGHKHLQRIERIDNSLRIGAGAVHPSRKEKGWLPRYNWLSVSIRRTKTQRFLDVDVYPRVWNDDLTRFVPDHAACRGEKHRKESLELEAWDPPATPAPAALATAAPQLPATSNHGKGAIMVELETSNAARKLTYRFLDLPHVVRIEIAYQLELYTNDDEGLRDPELFDRIFQRATRNKKLADLWDKVEQHHDDGRNPTNPFRGR